MKNEFACFFEKNPQKAPPLLLEKSYKQLALDYPLTKFLMEYRGLTQA